MTSLSRDDSELAFQKRQKELKKACHNFKQVLSDIKSMSQQTDILSSTDEHEEDTINDHFSYKINPSPNNEDIQKIKIYKNHIDYGKFDIEEEEEFPDPEKAELITESCELRAIIRELYSMKSDLINLTFKLRRVKGSQILIAKKLNDKISLITQVISRNISRAELLLIDLY